MEEKKKGKGVKVFLVIFIVLFVLAACALGYGYTKYQDLKTENKNLNTKYENANKKNDENNSELGKDVISSNSNKSFILNSITDADSDLEYNIYAVSDYGQIIGYKDSIYIIDVKDGSGVVNEWVNTCLTKANFNNDRYKCTIGESTDEPKEYDFYKTNVAESDITAASFAGGLAGAAEPLSYSFLIYNTGKVELFTNGKDKKEVFKSYKVKNVQTYHYQSETGKGNEFKITLEDGTIKTINELK